MAENGPNKAARDRMHAVLAAYGADPARWPHADRELAASLPDTALAGALEDARTLDSAMSRASRPVAPAGAAERLIARVDDGANVVQFARRAQAPHTRRAALPGRLAAMIALAASLALGIYLGASGQTDWLTSPLLAEESPEYLTAELDVLDGTLQLFEEHTQP
jgi:hypothetical protein